MPKIGKYWVDKDRFYWPHDTAHTWAKVEDGRVRIGVDDFAQKQVGEYPHRFATDDRSGQFVVE